MAEKCPDCGLVVSGASADGPFTCPRCRETKRPGKARNGPWWGIVIVVVGLAPVVAGLIWLAWLLMGRVAP